MKNLMRLMVVAILAIVSYATCMASSPAKEKVGGQTVEVSREIGNINSMEIEAMVWVVYEQNATPSLRLVGRKEYVENIVVTQDGDKLEFTAKNNKLYDSKNAKGMGNGRMNFDDMLVVAYVSSKSLKSVSVSSAGAFESKTPMRMDDISFEMDGASKVNIGNLKCGRLDFDVSGAAVLTANATAKSANLVFEGAVNANMILSNTSRTDVDVEGVANVDIQFVNGGTADCNVEGLGSLRLSGTLRRLTKEVSSMSHIYTSKLKITDVK